MFHNIYKKNAAYIKPFKKRESPNNLKTMDSDKLSLAHINAKIKKNKQEQSSAHHTSRKSILCKVYISEKIYT